MEMTGADAADDDGLRTYVRGDDDASDNGDPVDADVDDADGGGDDDADDVGDDDGGEDGDDDDVF